MEGLRFHLHGIHFFINFIVKEHISKKNIICVFVTFLAIQA